MTALGLLLLAAAVTVQPGQEQRSPFLCHTQEAAAIWADLPDNDIATLSDGLLSLLRRRDCIYLPAALRPVIIFEEMVERRSGGEAVWRVRWGSEAWYVALEADGKPT